MRIPITDIDEFVRNWYSSNIKRLTLKYIICIHTLLMLDLSIKFV
jgi:hypothetical protein